MLATAALRTQRALAPLCCCCWHCRSPAGSALRQPRSRFRSCSSGWSRCHICRRSRICLMMRAVVMFERLSLVHRVLAWVLARIGRACMSSAPAGRARHRRMVLGRMWPRCCQMKKTVVAVCVALLVAAAAAQTSSKKPPVPPGAPTRGFAIALLSDGIDYTRPGIAGKLARDGEGEIIGWDVVDNDRRPYRRSGPATRLIEIAPVLVVPYRLDPASAASWRLALRRSIGRRLGWRSPRLRQGNWASVRGSGP